jgi:polyisoprenyl-teichoic acid--peptidoglycan teichoic acid transferase
VPSDLPKIPGPSRATYTAKGGKRRLFKSRRHRPSFSGSDTAVHHAHKRRWPKRSLIGLVVILIVLAAGGVGGYLYGSLKLGNIPRVSVPALTPQKAGQPMDVLLAGSDSRACVTTPAGVKAFGSPTTQAGQRSDVIIIARFIGGGQVEMLSIPRDSWVPIAGTGGANKINAAFNSGPNQLVETIQDDFHIPINHVIWTTFCGFEGLVAAVGGIHLDFKYPVYDRYSGLYVTKTGCQLLEGPQALALVRSRHLFWYDPKTHSWNYDGNSDWSRIQRQQAFFHALLDQVHSSLPDIFKVNAFLDAAASGLTVDSGFTSGDMMSLGLHYHSLSNSDLVTKVIPTTPEVIDGQDALSVAQPYSERLVASFLAAGTTTPKSNGASTTSGPTSPPPSDVITDTPQDLPEPWNPAPC